jgi:hypothetical protein
METEQRLREALALIAQVAGSAGNGHVSGDHGGDGAASGGYGPDPGSPDLHGHDVHGHEGHGHGLDGEATVCTPKALPARLRQKAAQVARKVAPVNAPGIWTLGPGGGATDGQPLAPARIAVLVSKYWGPAPRRLTVSFLETTPADLRARILQHMNAWNAACGVSFVETASGGQVRISRGGGGYWSYLGTDVLLIPQSRPTMNLQGFTMSTPEAEYRRVVRHETGHTLGFPHEHMRAELVERIDPRKAYDYFWRTQGWDKPTVDEQVLTPLAASSIFGTPPDQTSIMCYQLPGSITRDGQPILGGSDINATDFAFAGGIYPRLGGIFSQQSAPVMSAANADPDDWGEAEDTDPGQVLAA